MPNLKIKIVGYAKDEVDSDWETHIVNSSISPVFSGTIDGFPIDEWKIDSVTPTTALDFRNNEVVIPVGSTFTYGEISSALIDIIYYHADPNATVMLTATGISAKYQIEFTINSIV